VVDDALIDHTRGYVMTLTAEYLLLGAAVLGGADLMLDEAKQSTQELGADFGKQVRHISKQEAKQQTPVLEPKQHLDPACDTSCTP